MAGVCNPSHVEAEEGGWLGGGGQPELQSETLSQKGVRVGNRRWKGVTH